MMQGCAVTERYTIFSRLPLVFGLEKMMGGGGLVCWDPASACRAGIVPRMGDDPSMVRNRGELPVARR